ncbi:hypothetical protein [Brevundimonas sp.]|uniref:hypothetical protein n=1 Tax=Brevundimonas sp. TaxID=1871086 RepID=UPI00289EF60D|nr:hypothetical protein [Brevundimonas sp.]
MSQLSPAAREFREQAKDTERFLETCEGGDPGSPEEPSIWFLGIEPGWNKEQQATENQPTSPTKALMDTYNIEAQLKFQYNQKAFKLLAAIQGRNPEDYVDFALSERPFEKGAKGYFKANLFPEPFYDVATWEEAAGFKTKEEYRQWMREHRFKVMKHWIEKCRPRMVIGTSYSHLHDYMSITGTLVEPQPLHFEVNGRPKRMYASTDGIVPLFVTPHLIGESGLNSYESKKIVASVIRKTLAM